VKRALPEDELKEMANLCGITRERLIPMFLLLSGLHKKTASQKILSTWEAAVILYLIY
jgi:hypothetical protein